MGSSRNPGRVAGFLYLLLGFSVFRPISLPELAELTPLKAGRTCGRLPERVPLAVCGGETRLLFIMKRCEKTGTV